MAQAFTNFPKTPQDFARLPPYCHVRAREKNSPAYEAWKKKLGEACWEHVHHYCAGLHNMYDAMSVTEMSRRETIMARAITGGFDYMWRAAGPECAMMPEILVAKGRALTLIKHEGEALESYRKSVELNPRYMPAYGEMASLYDKAGQAQAARTILEHALQIDPDNKPIQKQLERVSKSKAK